MPVEETLSELHGGESATPEVAWMAFGGSTQSCCSDVDSAVQRVRAPLLARKESLRVRPVSNQERRCRGKSITMCHSDHSTGGEVHCGVEVRRVVSEFIEM